MNFIKRLLFRFLGAKKYLLLVSKVFFLLYRLKFIKGNKLFDCHYFVNKLINKGDTVIDIGANLGYYSVIFSKIVGSKGKVYSVEPVELFRQVLESNTRGFSNIEIMPYALGEINDEKIKMGAPSQSTYFSHGRTHVLTQNDDCSMVFDAVIKRPDALFAHLSELHYIKCDIEGYEGIAIPLFDKLIDRFKPIMQIEIAGDNIEPLFNFFKMKDYHIFYLKGEQLIEMKQNGDESFGDFFFVHKSRIGELNPYFK